MSHLSKGLEDGIVPMCIVATNCSEQDNKTSGIPTQNHRIAQQSNNIRTHICVGGKVDVVQITDEWIEGGRGIAKNNLTT